MPVITYVSMLQGHRPKGPASQLCLSQMLNSKKENNLCMQSAKNLDSVDFFAGEQAVKKSYCEKPSLNSVIS